MLYVQSPEGPQYRVTRMFIYPIKSCGFIEVNKSWIIESTGLRFDRKWMIVNKQGVMLSQLREPKICLIQPKLNFETGNLELRFPGENLRGVLPQVLLSPLSLITHKSKRIAKNVT